MKDSRGYTIIKGSKNSSKEIFRKNGVYVTESSIPQTYTSSAIVFFVSGSNGDEYGQYPTRSRALEKARKMSKLSLNERRKFDE